MVLAWLKKQLSAINGRPGARQIALAAGFVFLCLAATSALAQGLGAVGAGKSLWVVRQETDDKQDVVRVLYRPAEYPAGQFRLARRLYGRLIHGGWAASGDKLWLVFSEGAVISLQAQPEMAAGGSPASFTTSTAPPLPRGVELRSLAANNDTLWALVRVRAPGALRTIDTSPAPPPPTTEPTTPTPPSTQPTPAPGSLTPGSPTPGNNEPSATESGVSPAGSAPGSAGGAPPAPDIAPSPGNAPNGPAISSPANTPPPAPEILEEASPEDDREPAMLSVALPVDRLLKLSRGQWRKVDLPGAWPAGRQSWLVLLTADDDQPLLVSTDPAVGRADVLWTFVHEDRTNQGAWLGRAHELTSAVEYRPLAVQGQLVLVRRYTGDQGLSAQLRLLRGQSISDLGTLTISGGVANTPYAVAALGDRVVLIAAEAEGKYRWAGMDLQGRLVMPVSPIVEVAASGLSQSPDVLFLLVGMAAVASAIVFVLLKREGAEQVELASGLVLAELPSRSLAAVIDLAPCVLLAMATFRQWDLLALVQQWPGRSTGWDAMAPAAMVIGLLVIHTALSEALTGKTLGKRIMGLHVADVEGGKPLLWQILARNALKVLDLVLPPLLVMPMLSSLRQRLGDIAARTVVLADPVDLDAVEDPGAADKDQKNAGDESSSRSAKREKDDQP
ncbi:MAG: RDD family protein [Phycisphaeraceae bacterium]|nr:RDD family protein [Phycisphaeraceae bacterium]